MLGLAWRVDVVVVAFARSGVSLVVRVRGVGAVVLAWACCAKALPWFTVRLTGEGTEPAAVEEVVGTAAAERTRADAPRRASSGIPAPR